jgi:hypothetical protein
MEPFYSAARFMVEVSFVLSVKPVSMYPRPAYPTQAEVMNDPEILRALPRRFLAKPAVVTAMSALISLGLTGCGASPVDTPDVMNTPSASPAGEVLKVPVFIHGGGRGSYGCESVAPPVFLSEEEAAQVIREEAELYGIDFSGNKTLSKVSLPVPELYYFPDEKSDMKTASGDLSLDGYDSDKELGFEFVSVSDVQAWSKLWDADRMSTVESYDTSGSAQKLSESVERTAVFYDPLSADYKEWDPPSYEGKTNEEYDAEIKTAIEDYQTEQKEKSLTELRAQVKDFLEWLKGQGII